MYWQKRQEVIKFILIRWVFKCSRRPHFTAMIEAKKNMYFPPFVHHPALITEGKISNKLLNTTKYESTE